VVPSLPFSHDVAEREVEQPGGRLVGREKPAGFRIFRRCMWRLSMVFHTPPYRYQWSGKLSGTNSFVTGNIETSGYLNVDIWDASGQYVRKSLYVTVTRSCGGRVAC
jgi:hypothetical protein